MNLGWFWGFGEKPLLEHVIVIAVTLLPLLEDILQGSKVRCLSSAGFLPVDMLCLLIQIRNTYGELVGY